MFFLLAREKKDHFATFKKYHTLVDIYIAFLYDVSNTGYPCWCSVFDFLFFFSTQLWHLPNLTNVRIPDSKITYLFRC